MLDILYSAFLLRSISINIDNLTYPYLQSKFYCWMENYLPSLKLKFWGRQESTLNTKQWNNKSSLGSEKMPIFFRWFNKETSIYAIVQWRISYYCEHFFLVSNSILISCAREDKIQQNNCNNNIHRYTMIILATISYCKIRTHHCILQINTVKKQNFVIKKVNIKRWNGAQHGSLVARSLHFVHTPGSHLVSGSRPCSLTSHPAPCLWFRKAVKEAARV